MPDRVVQVAIRADAGPQVDPEELEQLTTTLRRQLLDLDVESVERARIGEPPAGTRAVDVLSLGTLVVSVVRSSTVLQGLVGALQSWVLRSSSRSVKLELDGDTIELSGASAGQQQQLIDLWIVRHSS